MESAVSHHPEKGFDCISTPGRLVKILIIALSSPLFPSKKDTRTLYYRDAAMPYQDGYYNANYPYQGPRYYNDRGHGRFYGSKYYSLF
jgi:hypothetical protein